MIFSSFVRLKFLLLLFMGMMSISAAAQQQSEGLQRVEIIWTDSFKIGEKFHRLLGNVELQHNNIIMKCDSAYQFPENKFEAYGNVHLINGSTTVRGDTMMLDGNINLAKVRGRIVYLNDSTTTLRTTAIDYDTKEEIGFFQNEGTIADSASLLESKQGYYYSKLKDFVFIGNVESETENYTLISDSMKYNIHTKIFDFYSYTHIWSNNSYLYCDKGWYDSENEKMFFLKNSYLLSDKQEVWADSIYYEGFSKQGQLYRNIQLLDTNQRTIAFGDFSDFNLQSEDFELTKDPSILFYSENPEEDTLYMRADWLRSVMSPRSEEFYITDSITGEVDSTFREIFGIKNVRVFRSDVQAACDSLYFNTLDSTWKMYYEPVIWNGEKMQLTGDTIKFFVLNGKVERGEFQDNAMVVMPEEDTTSRYYNQISGKKMVSYFMDNELNYLDVLGNVQSYFFSSSDQAISDHEASTMTMRFKERKVRQVVYYDQITAKAVPYFLREPEKFFLKGYKWHGDKHPKSKEDILTRTVRPSIRREVNEIEQPTFPITKRIDEIENILGKPTF